MARAVSRRVLLGRVPVLALAPPTRGLRSTIAARLPKAAAADTALSPAGPEPMTIKSYEVGSIRRMIPRPEAGAKRREHGNDARRCRNAAPRRPRSHGPGAIGRRIAYNE